MYVSTSIDDTVHHVRHTPRLYGRGGIAPELLPASVDRRSEPEVRESATVAEVRRNVGAKLAWWALVATEVRDEAWRPATELRAAERYLELWGILQQALDEGPRSATFRVVMLALSKSRNGGLPHVMSGWFRLEVNARGWS